MFNKYNVAVTPRLVVFKVDARDVCNYPLEMTVFILAFSWVTVGYAVFVVFVPDELVVVAFYYDASTIKVSMKSEPALIPTILTRDVSVIPRSAHKLEIKLDFIVFVKKAGDYIANLVVSLIVSVNYNWTKQSYPSVMTKWVV